MYIIYIFLPYTHTSCISFFELFYSFIPSYPCILFIVLTSLIKLFFYTFFVSQYIYTCTNSHSRFSLIMTEARSICRHLWLTFSLILIIVIIAIIIVIIIIIIIVVIITFITVIIDSHVRDWAFWLKFLDFFLIFSLLFYYFFILLQIPVIDTNIRTKHSFFHSATRKVCHHSRARWQHLAMQSTGNQIMVHHLVMGLTSTLLTTQIGTLVHTQTLASTTPFQVEYKTRKQSWLGLTPSHLMKWKSFTSVNITLTSFLSPILSH